MMILIDNYDSFSYNLYQLLGESGQEIQVIRNDEKTVQQIREMKPDYLVLSPGPGRPADAGICEQAVKELADEIPILGVCLGHQAICEAFGGAVTYAKQRMHGKASTLFIEKEAELFQGLGSSVSVARYHSLAAEEASLPESLRIVARTKDDEIMAVQHETLPIYGVQFHPESILTPKGDAMIRNFLRAGKSQT